MRLILDCDGVLADILTPWLKRLGLDPDYVVTEWDLGCTGLPPQRIKDALSYTMDHPLRLEPYPGTLEVLSTLREQFTEVHCVTALMRQGRYLWLKDRLGFSSDTIHLSKNKRFFKGDIFVDDYPPHVRHWQDENTHGLGYVIAQPYNRGWHPELPRLKTLEELCTR